MKLRTLLLCAGLGTRVRPLTDRLPKALLPVGEEPLISHTLRNLAAQGVEEVAINLHYKGDLIRDYCGHGEAWGLSITYFEEPSLLGTAGTVKALGHWLTPDHQPFLVIYGDILTDEDFRPMLQAHLENRADATIWSYAGRDNSIIKTDEDGRIEFFLERPSPEAAEKIYHLHPSHLWINGGVQILSAGLLDLIPAAPADLPRDVYMPYAGRKNFRIHPLQGYRLNIDSVDALEKAGRDWNKSRKVA